MDAKLDILALLLEQRDHLRHGVLALGYGKAVPGRGWRSRSKRMSALPRHDDDVPGVRDGLDRLLDVPDSGSTGDLLGLASTSARSSEPSQDDVRKRPGIYHDCTITETVKNKTIIKEGGSKRSQPNSGFQCYLFMATHMM